MAVARDIAGYPVNENGDPFCERCAHPRTDYTQWGWLCESCSRVAIEEMRAQALQEALDELEAGEIVPETPKSILHTAPSGYCEFFPAMYIEEDPHERAREESQKIRLNLLIILALLSFVLLLVLI